MDTLYIEGLTARAVIGIYDWERSIKQRLVVDLETAINMPSAQQSECIENVLSYETLSNRLVEVIEASEFQLVETLAEELAKLVMQEFSVAWLRLRLSKPDAVPAAKNVGICIERGVKPVS